MDFLRNLEWNTILTVLAVAAFVLFMFKGGCGAGMCGMGTRKENEAESYPKESQHMGRR